MKRPKPLEVTREDIQALRDRAKRGELSVSAEDAELIESLAETVVVLSEAVEKKGTSIRRLLRLLFGSKTESKDRLFGKKKDQDDDDRPGGSPAGKAGGEPKARAKGHGRNAADAYSGAERVSVKHAKLRAGGPCPVCPCGKLRQLDPSRLVHQTVLSSIVAFRPRRSGRLLKRDDGRPGSAGAFGIDSHRAPAGGDLGDIEHDRSARSEVRLLAGIRGVPS